MCRFRISICLCANRKSISEIQLEIGLPFQLDMAQFQSHTADSLRERKIVLACSIYPEDGGGNLHLTVEKSDMEDMHGCYLIVLNQNMPYQLNFSFAFDDKDKITNEAHFAAYGIKFSSGTHSARMLGCADDDRTSLIVFTGYGIFFSKISHTVDKFHNWWTFMISLWYPVIIFSILPAVWLVQKLRGTKPPIQSEAVKM